MCCWLCMCCWLATKAEAISKLVQKLRPSERLCEVFCFNTRIQNHREISNIKYKCFFFRHQNDSFSYFPFEVSFFLFLLKFVLFLKNFQSWYDPVFSLINVFTIQTSSICMYTLLSSIRKVRLFYKHILPASRKHSTNINLEIVILIAFS